MAGPIELQAGIVDFTLVHNGTGSFVVDLVKPDGMFVDNLVQ